VARVQCVDWAHGAWWPLAFVALGGCISSHPRVSVVPALTLSGTDGRPHDLASDVAAAKLTVYVFFSAHCPCLVVHEARIRALENAYESRGVQFFAVDSEATASLDRDRIEARAHAYLFPILVDHGAIAADAMGAEYATYTVVFDQSGRVRYSGAIDSDRVHLTGDARPFLRDALDELLAGQSPSATHVEALGCALQKW
jgi:peroxiredoxin